MPNDEKIIERIVKNQLVQYIEDNNLISPYQSAFRSNYSCESTLNLVIDDWKRANDQGEQIVIVFLDLKRAFETIDRKKMLQKLEQMGVDGVELNWFRSYLNSRKQQTKFKGHTSNEINIEIGLPQGTALSVILFLIYIDSITKVPMHGSIFLFADDTVLVVKNKSLEGAIRMMNEDLDRIYNWLNLNKLKLNNDKTKWMTITRGQNINNRTTQTVKIANEQIERVSEIKYLGIVIDENLNFDKQIGACVKKTASKVNFLCRISRNFTLDTKKIIYNSIVLPHFNYCSTIYINCSKEQIAVLQKIQNKAMRIILNCDRDTPRTFMLDALNMMSIAQRIKYNVLIFIFKIVRGMMPNYLKEKLIYTRNIHNVNTRQNTENVLRLPNYRLETTRMNLFYNGIKLFNDLPVEIRNKETLNSFKKECDKYVKENYEI